MKILVVHAYAGIGHKKAAEAIGKALLDAGAETKVIDVLDYTNAFFKFSYPRVYLFLINKIPFLWGCLYYFFDLRLVDFFCAPVRRFFHNLQADEFIRFVIEKNPDVIVCTHFLPAEVVSALKKKNIFNGRLVTVITDFLPHSFWLARQSDYFIGAVEKTKKELIKRGIEKERIKTFGIPTDSVFSVSKGRKPLIKRLGLKENCFNLLIMGGGFGTGPVKEVVNAISNLGSKMKDGLQVVVICGKNKALLKDLKKIGASSEIELSVFGYMNNIDEFMEVSDLIITKSGGLTVSESLSKRLPMIIIQPIPGQETKNCKILESYGVAVRANTVGQIMDHIRYFVSDPKKITGMKTQINLLAYPDAAKDIADLVMNI
ncbi:glycosyltransferase [Candidatus Omnitrophota bacterium]